MTQNLLFDLGGVIIDIRRQDCVDAFLRLGFSDIQEFLGEYGQKGFFLKLEEGAITPDEFHAEVRCHIPGKVSDAQIDEAFNAFITGIPLERLQALRALRHNGHKLYVISNTNIVMWQGAIAKAFAQEGLSVSDYFDGIATSFEIGICKPDEAIFKKIINDFGILPEETTYFDDSADNCRIGAALGFKTVHVPPGSSFLRFIGNDLQAD